MNAKFSIFYFLLVFFCLYGCNSTVKMPSAPDDSKNYVVKEKKNISERDHLPKNAASHLTQCNRDLESLRTVSLTAYRRYQSEYDGLMKSSAGFMAVRDDVSPEVAELARPKFQFALVNLCYRIKDALAQTLINQAGGR